MGKGKIPDDLMEVTLPDGRTVLMEKKDPERWMKKSGLFKKASLKINPDKKKKKKA